MWSALISTNFGSTGRLHYFSAVHKVRAYASYMDVVEHSMNAVNFQIGQCRVTVEVDRTKDFYRELPRISENCNCKDCEHFENVVTDMNIRLFEMLNKMGVNLKRQPNIIPDGVCSTGETDKFQRTYMGYYKLFGNFGKAERTPAQVNSEGEPTAFEFRETEEDAFVQYTIKQESTNELTVDFFIECERK